MISWIKQWLRKQCPACSGTGLGPVRKTIGDTGDVLYTVYAACKKCDGTGARL